MNGLHAKGDSIKSLRDIHAAYITKIRRKCLVHSDIAVAAVNHTLSTILAYCSALDRLGLASSAPTSELVRARLFVFARVYRRIPTFSSCTKKQVHALKGLVCRNRMASSPAATCKQGAALTSLTRHACGCARPSRARLCHMNGII
jgi:hypothetical protein